LSFLAEKNVAATPRQQALNALIFLYKRALDINLGDGISPTRAKRRMKLPTVLTSKEVSRWFVKMKVKHALMAKLLYGCGLRLMECARFRVKEVDFGHGRIFIRNSKEDKDRAVILPDSIRRQ
jgi:integrase